MRLPLATALLALMHLPFTFAQATEPGSTAMGPLLQAIHERLALADQVALSKWDSGKAVEDPARERQVIANARARAPAFNLDPDRVERLFRAQIEASKQVQNARLSQWRTAGRAPDTPRQDLAQDIRPELDRLQTQLLQSYADVQPFQAAPACRRWLSAGLGLLPGDPVHAQALVLATAEVCATDP